MKIAFIGCGAAGFPLAYAWRVKGHALGAIHARTSAPDIVARLGAGVAGGPLDDADVVVFATPDDALADAARAHPLENDQVALHLSGALPSTVLAPTGARTAGLHPLRAFADSEASLEALPETWFFVEGEAVDVAEELAYDLGPNVARIDTDRKVSYHAGAAIASNYTVTLVAWAADLFEQAGVGRADALDALVELVRGSVDNVARVGLPRCLTGPVARGDTGLVAQHADALDGNARALYLALARATIPIAKAKGTLSAESEAALRELIE